jgi:hypothetical protein
MGEWNLRDYLRPSGSDGETIFVNEILEWTLKQPKKAQAKIDIIILSLQAWNVWPPHYVSALTGCPGILELRIKSFGVEYRPLGCYGPRPRDFTLLIGAIEKGGKLPSGTCQAATERKNLVLRGWPTREHEFTQSNS